MTSGCQSSVQQQQSVRRVDPVLSMAVGRTELVNYLNQQNQGLNGWRCMSTKMQVSLPGMPTQRLNGYIACQSPKYFRLTADNLIAKADLGSNNAQCWVYVKPGESAVMTWKHEDTKLLQQVPTGVPYIDPNWLMLVLGISPLDPNDYELSRAPTGKSELWLTAIEQGPNGRSLRRVIKVDAMNGVVREHAVYDSEANALVRAQLSGHQRRDGHLIPTQVKLMFPQMESELLLTFKGIETNPQLPDHLWHLPDNNVQVVDLGELIRQRMLVQNADSPQPFASPAAIAPTLRARLQPPVFHQPQRTAFGADSDSMSDANVVPTAGVEEPDWDTPISFSRTQERSASFEQTQPAPPLRRSFLSRMLGR
ncbi:MAG: hypothetical protein R3C59_04595 [Planctomycetaceae bacterium]